MSPPVQPPVQPRSFEAALAEAVPLAQLAPSSHNSQPWALGRLPSGAVGAGEDVQAHALVVCLDEARALRTLPAHAMEMNLSCGLFLHALATALRARGWAGQVRWLVGQEPRPALPPDWPSTWSPRAVLLLRSAPPDEAAQADCALLSSRITNRAPYKPDPVDLARLRNCFGSSLSYAPEAPGLALTTFQEPSQLTALGAFVTRHAAIDFGHAAAWRETHAYLRFDEKTAAAAGDGFLLTQLFGPLSVGKHWFYRVALHPLTMRLLTWFGYPRIIARGLGLLLGGSPAALCLAIPSEAPTAADEVLAGASLMQGWLAMTAAGLALHPVSVILQHDWLRAEFQRSFDLTGRVVFFARTGAPMMAFPRTFRRDLALP